MAEAVFLGTGPQSRPVGAKNCGTATLRASASLTTSYVASDYAKVSHFERVDVRLLFDWDDATSVEWYYEWSADGTTFYPEQNIATSAGTSTFTAQVNTRAVAADVNWADALYVTDNYLRVQIKRTGGAGTNAMTVALTGLGL